MDTFLRWLAARRGIELDPGTELRLELSSFPSGGLGFVYILALVAMLAIVVFAYRRDAQRLSRGRRALLATLRALAVCAAFFLLLEPDLVAVKRDVRPGSVAVLVDTSQSMTHDDTYRRTPEIAAAWRESGVRDPASTSRIELADHVLRREDAALIRDLAKNNDVFVYGFHSGLDALGSFDVVDAEEEATETSYALEPLTATGRYSNLGNAVRGALERHRDATLAGLLLLSDGRRNLGGQGSEIARLVEQRKVAHTLVLPVGDPSETQTLRLTRIDAPDKVFQKDPFTVRANIESQGYESVTANVRLERQADGGAVEVLQTQSVQLGDGAREALVEFADLRSQEPGVYTYLVRVEPPEFEPETPERHVQRQQIEVLGEKTRVLLISGGPSHELRFLRTQLIRDNTVELSSWLLSADPDFPQDGDVVLERLPEDREAMDAFDVFIFLDPDSSKLSEEFCRLVRVQVEESGAGLWWICGEIYTLDALRPTASTRVLSEILPVVPDVERADQNFGLGRARSKPMPIRLTPNGARHKVARLSDTAEISEQIWAALPGIFVGFPVEKTKPGAAVIAEFNNAKLRQFGPIPLIATQFFGAGRVLYSGTDDTYRWRARHENAYNRFWIKGIRHLFEGRLSAGNSRLSLTLDEEKVELGTPQRIVADVKDETFEPWVSDSFELELESEDGSVEPLQLSPVEGVPGQYEIRLWPTQLGFFRVRPAQPVGREVNANFQVVAGEFEKHGPASLATLGAIAAAPGGATFSSPLTFAAAARAIPSMAITDTTASRHPIWDSWVTILVILGLLSAEWWLRKRSNLL